MRVLCDIEEVYLENDQGIEVEGIRAICGRCGHEADSFGTSDRSINRCLLLLRETYPERESNFYVDGEGDEE